MGVSKKLGPIGGTPPTTPPPPPHTHTHIHTMGNPAKSATRTNSSESLLLGAMNLKNGISKHDKRDFKKNKYLQIFKKYDQIVKVTFVFV